MKKMIKFLEDHKFLTRFALVFLIILLIPSVFLSLTIYLISINSVYAATSMMATIFMLYFALIFSVLSLMYIVYYIYKEKRFQTKSRGKFSPKAHIHKKRRRKR